MNYMSAGIIAAIAFVAGAFVSSPDLRAFAAASITSGDIVDGTIQSVDIKNGAVANADLAPNAVTTSKINDGAVKSADIGDFEIAWTDIKYQTINSFNIDPNLIDAVTYADGTGGWTPDGIKTTFSVTHGTVTSSSVIVVNLTFSDAICNAEHPITDAFSVVCNKPPTDGSIIRFVVINA